MDKETWKEITKKTLKKRSRKSKYLKQENLVAWKVDNFTVHQKFGSIEEFKLKSFDQI